MNESGFLLHFSIYLAAAVVAVPIATRLGLGSVLGYLVAGLAIGPSGFGWVGSEQDVLHFAEFGVVIMLFLVGLELTPGRLWDLRGPIFGLGSSQVLVTGLMLFGLGIVFGASIPVATVSAMGLSLSSTAIALQIFAERNQLTTTGGRAGFAVLLFQDLAVIPMLALLPLFANQPGTGAFDWFGAAKATGVIAAIIIGGRFLLLPLLRYVAATQIREIFTASALLIVIAIALLMQAVGMSMALGTFLAGVLLANSEYRHALETDLEPFKGLLLGLFFMAIGLSVDLALIQTHWRLLLGLVVALVLTKVLVLWVLARLFHVPSAQRAFFAFTVSQGGEFAFVLNSSAHTAGILSSEVTGILVAVVALSMMTTPLLLILHDRWIEPWFSGTGKPAYDAIEDEGNPVIVAGYGRVGQIVGRLLTANHVGITVLDHDPLHIGILRKFGHQVFYGDATRLDLLSTAGAAKAKILVVAIDDPDHSLRLIDAVRETFPHLAIIARARNVQHAFELMARDVELFERETFESALLLGERVLVQLGYGPYAAHRIAAKFRDHDLKSLELRYQARGDEEHLISVVRESRQQLDEALTSDQAEFHREAARNAWN